MLKTETKSVSDILSFKGLYLSSLKWLCGDILGIPTMLPIAGRQTGTKILEERNVEVARSDQWNTGKPIRNIIWALEEEERYGYLSYLPGRLVGLQRQKLR